MRKYLILRVIYPSNCQTEQLFIYRANNSLRFISSEYVRSQKGSRWGTCGMPHQVAEASAVVRRGTVRSVKVFGSAKKATPNTHRSRLGFCALQTVTAGPGRGARKIKLWRGLLHCCCSDSFKRGVQQKVALVPGIRLTRPDLLLIRAVCLSHPVRWEACSLWLLGCYIIVHDSNFALTRVFVALTRVLSHLHIPAISFGIHFKSVQCIGKLLQFQSNPYYRRTGTAGIVLTFGTSLRA